MTSTCTMGVDSALVCCLVWSSFLFFSSFPSFYYFNRKYRSVTKVAFTLGQNTPRKMVVFKMKKTIFNYQVAKSTLRNTLCVNAP